ncbi:chaperone modulator CbpM [Actinacidiphila acididurans]|uniref:MerR family transcriptional regulator n=1 Tax=Actinacidiphila acididurans TaxID=2784346 RepID=A0ABS2U4Y4_9ACTN|nr:chaperone modulator CbpM [Actinacidiphila acididurans]MBM9509198.1 MerR family transcriptional regulator [Actinacidiphila acididurans]
MRDERRSPAESTGQAGTRAAYPLVRVYRTGPSPYQLPMAGVAGRSGLPAELVSRFVALGLVDAERDARGRLWFRTSAPSAIARVQRLRDGLCLNYAAIGVVLDLLDRIESLETALRRSERAAKEPTTWT